MNFSSDQLEEVNCNFCSNDLHELSLTKNGLNIVKCKNCGLVYSNPRLKKQVVFSRYSNKYFEDEYLPYIKNNLDSIISHYNNVLDYIIGNLSIERRRMLEIGCGTGLFLHTARQRGFQVYGIEYNMAMANYGKKEYQVNILQVDIDDREKLSDENYDVIILMDVIEHLFDPYSTLSKSYDALNTNGLIFISTPNIESKFFKEQRGEWNMISPQEHLYYYSEKTLSMVLSKIGFTILKIHYGNEETKDVIFLLAKK